MRYFPAPEFAVPVAPSVCDKSQARYIMHIWPVE